jgi:hypothetical protein
MGAGTARTAILASRALEAAAKSSSPGLKNAPTARHGPVGWATEDAALYRVALRIPDHDFRAAIAVRMKPRGPAALPSRFVAVVCFAHALAGCAAGFAAPPGQRPAVMPAPSRALLTAPAKPDCTFHETGLGDTVSDAAESARQKLDYERLCYRRAEMQMRARLQRLQAAIAAGTQPSRRRCGLFCGLCEAQAAGRLATD